jgi:hypothetical protein
LCATLQEYITGGLAVRVFDCDNPAKMERDDSIGSARVSLSALMYEDAAEFSEAVMLKGKQCGTLTFSATWQPPAPSDDDLAVSGKGCASLHSRRGRHHSRELCAAAEPHHANDRGWQVH